MQPCFQPTQHPSTSARLQPLQVWQQPANDDTPPSRRPHLHRVADEGMQPCGIRTGDMLSIEHRQPRSGEIVLVRLNGRLLVRRLRLLAGQTLLLADQPGFPPCYVLEGDQLEQIGVVCGRFRL